jgi:hypothetical protein
MNHASTKYEGLWLHTGRVVDHFTIWCLEDRQSGLVRHQPLTME